MDYSLKELMVIEASRHLHDGQIVLAGTGIPLITILLATKSHAPNLCTLIETGSINPQLLPSPVSVSDPRTQHKAIKLGSLREVLGTILQRGLVDVGMIGGAQIDQYANVNSTVIGDYSRPSVRLPGSGGANDLASHAKNLLIITSHERRRFPPNVDYITSPGYVNGPDGRQRAGLPILKPDITVVTDLCVMRIDPTQGRLCVEALMPGISIDDVLDQTMFHPIVLKSLKQIAPPTPDILHLLREEVDPLHAYFDTE